MSNNLEWRKIAKYPNYEISATALIRSLSTKRVISQREIRDQHTGALSRKVILFNSRNGYNVEAFVEEHFRAAFPELAGMEKPIRVIGLDHRRVA